MRIKTPASKSSQGEFQSNQVPEIVGKCRLMLPVIDDIVDDDLRHLQRRQRDQRHQHPAYQARDDDAGRRLPYHPENRRHVFQGGDAFAPSRREFRDEEFGAAGAGETWSINGPAELSVLAASMPLTKGHAHDQPLRAAKCPLLKHSPCPKGQV